MSFLKTEASKILLNFIDIFFFNPIIFLDSDSPSILLNFIEALHFVVDLNFGV